MIEEEKSEKELSGSRRTGIFAALIIGMFVTSMATTVTANMIPNFTEYFGVSANLAQWLTSGATLVSGIVIPVTAFLIKKLPNRLYFFAAMTAYTVGSLLVCVSRSFTLLLVCRLIQALGCGMMIPFTQVILLHIYPAERHGRIMAAYSMASMVSSIVGPTYAGLILDFFGWRGVFASLFVFGVIILVIGGIFMKNIIPKEDADLNVGYVALSAAGFVSFVIGVSNLSGGSLLRLSSGGLISLGVLLLIIFSKLQLKSKAPMLNLNVFRDASFRIAVLISVCLYLISMGSAMILPILTKTLCGYSDSSYGYATIVGAILAFFSTLFAGRLYDRTGIKPLFFTGVIFYAAYAVMGYLSTDKISLVYIAVAYAIQNVAMAMLNSPATTMALSRLSGSLRIDGSAVLNTLRQISSSLASTVSVLIFTLAGSDFNAVHTVYIYYMCVAALILVSVLVYLRGQKRLKR